MYKHYVIVNEARCRDIFMRFAHTLVGKSRAKAESVAALLDNVSCLATLHMLKHKAIEEPCVLTYWLT